jgi:diaminopimelate epimerase
MQGSGNDYIIMDGRNEIIKELNKKDLAQTLCKRNYFVGADGLILLYESSAADVKMRIFNADGSEAEMCGNGIRCFSKYCYENEIVKKVQIRIETLSGIKKTWLFLKNNKVKKVKVDMGKPIFEREEIPVLGKGDIINEEIKILNKKFKITCLSIGNPHCVIMVDEISNFPVKTFGPIIERHNLFPNRINVEFVQIVKQNEIKVRVWERGVGETLACGTGACASVVVGNLLGKVSRICNVFLKGGELKIRYEDKNIFLTGPAEKVFEGTIEMEGLY